MSFDRSSIVIQRNSPVSFRVSIAVDGASAQVIVTDHAVNMFAPNQGADALVQIVRDAIAGLERDGWLPLRNENARERRECHALSQWRLNPEWVDATTERRPMTNETVVRLAEYIRRLNTPERRVEPYPPDDRCRKLHVKPVDVTAKGVVK